MKLAKDMDGEGTLQTFMYGLMPEYVHTEILLLLLNY